jgi:enoyl-CoA hydratase/carnithine racemase
MAENPIKVRVEGEIAYIALNRPEKRNAINQAMLRALPEAIDEVDRNDVRAIIIYGEGQAFSAGIDFTSLSNDSGAQAGQGGGPDMQRFRRFVAESQASLNRIESVEKPVIGALHGFVGGLGLELALACDARIASVGARLGMPEVRIGLVPDVGGTTRLTRTVGYARSKELIMTARMIEAADAEKIGLVNRVARGRAREADHRQGSRSRQDDVPGARSARAELAAAHRRFSRRRDGAGAAARAPLQGTLRRISKPASKVWPGASSRIPAATPRAARLNASGAQVYGSSATTGLAGGAKTTKSPKAASARISTAIFSDGSISRARGAGASSFEIGAMRKTSS